MHRIDTPSAQIDKFGAGKNGFTRGNPQTGVPATALDDDYFDAVQEELAGVVEAAGFVLNKANRAQLLAAIQKLVSEGIPDLKDATLNQKGIVQLSNSTNSTSQALAATPKAVSDLGNLLLKITNNLSEIKDAGPEAVTTALANLGLGDAAERVIGTASANVPDIAIADSRYKSIDDTPALSRVWISAEYKPVQGTPTIVNHGLTDIDVLHCKADVLLKCVVADAGYSPGDFAAGWSIHSNPNAATAPLPALSSTTIQTNTGPTGTGILVNGKGGGGSYGAVLANWRYILRIFY